jgi:hypothetical protein
MRNVAFIILLALGLAVYGCGNNPPNAVTTNTNGNWEALLSGGTGPSSQLDFVIDFSVSNTTGEAAQGLSITGFSFINNGLCFLTGVTATNQGGSATITTESTGQVTGSMSLTITSNAIEPAETTQVGNTLQLTADSSSGGGVSGTSNGTTYTTGTLSNGVAWGVWNLSSTNASNTNCGGTTPITGTFIMCQNSAACTIP